MGMSKHYKSGFGCGSFPPPPRAPVKTFVSTSLISLQWSNHESLKIPTISFLCPLPTSQILKSISQHSPKNHSKTHHYICKGILIKCKSMKTPVPSPGEDQEAGGDGGRSPLSEPVSHRWEGTGPWTPAHHRPEVIPMIHGEAVQLVWPVWGLFSWQ